MINAVKAMVNLLEKKYGMKTFEQNNGQIYVETPDGMDGGDIMPNGDYVYGLDGESVNFERSSRGRIIEILDDYYNV